MTSARSVYNAEFLYLTTTGRRTGEPREIEIWFAEHEGSYYLCAQNRERADWVRNIQVNPIVAFWVNGRKLTGMAKIVALGDGDAEKVKQLFDAIHEWSDGLLVRLTPDSDNVTPSEGHDSGR